MKNLIFIICLLLTTSVFARHRTIHSIHARTADGYLVYFRIDKALVGAEIEIYAANGEKVLAKKLSKRNALLDFYFENAGTYTITIKKGDQEIKFSFTKESPLPEMMETNQPILLTEGLSND